jgi:hypothetical protein
MSILRAFLQSFFDNLGLSTYYLVADSDAEFPYIVYSLRSSYGLDDAGNYKVLLLELNVYNDKNDMENDNILDYLGGEIIKFDIMINGFGLYGFYGYPRYDVVESEPITHKCETFYLHVYNTTNC